MGCAQTIRPRAARRFGGANDGKYRGMFDIAARNKQKVSAILRRNVARAWLTTTPSHKIRCASRAKKSARKWRYNKKEVQQLKGKEVDLKVTCCYKIKSV